MHKGNEERNKKIVKHVEDGWTYGQVAEVMGMTRCAVAGVVHRDKVKRKLQDLEGIREGSSYA